MSDPTFSIATPRLLLSYLLPESDVHCDFLVRLYNTPEFIASIGGSPTSITTRDAARKTLAGRFRNEHARNGYGTYLVSLKSTSGGDAVAGANVGGSGDVAEARNGAAEEGLSGESTPIGTVSLMRGEPPNCYSAPDLGFAILPEYMRKGYAKEAAQALLEYAEKELGVKDVLGLFDPTNEASKGVFRSLGFEDRGLNKLKVFGGVMGSVWTKPGMAEDLSVYGL